MYADDGAQFVLTYAVSDAAGNNVSQTFTVELQDTTYPVLTVAGDTEVQHEAGVAYADEGAAATDTLEDALGRNMNIVVDNPVQSRPERVPAWFTVGYRVCDRAGNCVNDTRSVLVNDTTPPVITLLGDEEMVVEAGENFSSIHPGVELEDVFYEEANLTLVVDEGGYEAVPQRTPATYNVTYDSWDPSGNRARAGRVITVVDTTAPDLVVGGSREETVGDGVAWSDPGVVRAYDIVDGDVRSLVDVVTALEVEGQR